MIPVVMCIYIHDYTWHDAWWLSGYLFIPPGMLGAAFIFIFLINRAEKIHLTASPRLVNK